MRQPGRHPESVFMFAGKPIKHVNTKSWRGALERAGPVQNGVPLYDLQEMGRWKSAEMVRRYAHLALAQMAKHTAVLGPMLAVNHDTPVAQGVLNGSDSPNKKSSHDCS